MSSSAAVWPAAELLGDVLVDPVGGVARLVERDGADRDEQRDHDRGEDRVDDEDGGRARHLQSREVADERVERERDDARGQEQEEDVAERRREQEREDQQRRGGRPAGSTAGSGSSGRSRPSRIVPWSPASARRRPCYGPDDGDSALPSRGPPPRGSPPSAGPRATHRGRRASSPCSPSPRSR